MKIRQHIGRGATRARAIAGLLALMTLPWSCAPTASAAERPNVLLIVTDDQGWGDVGSHGNAEIDTPTMDRLASSGARFDRFFVSPMCGPSRASLLTGRWNLRTGASWVSHGKEIMRRNEVTIGDALAKNGYATGCFGKWHNGEYGPYHPNNRGFQRFFGFCRGALENYFDAVVERNGEPVRTKGYITDVLTDAAMAFIEENQGRPFFCYMAYNAPHHPYHVPEKDFVKYLKRGIDEVTASVYGMVENIDHNLARLLAKLDELQLTNNTIVIFMSDNGPWGPARYNDGMRGIKTSVDEGGVRVPLFVRWPGKIQAGSIVTQIAAHVDLFPTILEFCMAPAPETLPLDGRSLAPLLYDKDGDWPDRMIFSHQNRLGETHMTPGSVRTQQYRLVNRGDGYELYDMIADPGQETDISDAQPEVTRNLAEAYAAWYSDVVSDGVAPPALPVGYEPGRTVALQAEDSRLRDGLKFRRHAGWAHDSALNWMSVDASVAWEIDVLRPGRYAITLMYGCAQNDIGAKVRVEIGNQSSEATIREAHDPLPSNEKARNRSSIWTSGPVPIMTWLPLAFEPIALNEGRTRLLVLATGLPGQNAFELKEARIRLVE